MNMAKYCSGGSNSKPSEVVIDSIKDRSGRKVPLKEVESGKHYRVTFIKNKGTINTVYYMLPGKCLATLSKRLVYFKFKSGFLKYKKNLENKLLNKIVKI